MFENRIRVWGAFPLALLLTGCAGDEEEPTRPGTPFEGVPPLEAVQPDLFSAPGAQPLAWADFDGDGDLDLFVGFRGAPNRLYRNDAGVFVDVAPELGVDDLPETRAAAWGDYDADGDPDLFVGFRLEDDYPNRVYRNDGPEGRWVNVAGALEVALSGNTRQTSWIDYDGDGDLDLFMAFREQPNRLFRNEGEGVPFTDVTEASGLGDPRKTVGVAWFDMDADGDLDAFVANQEGDEDGFFRNDGGVFRDVARELGMSSAGRPPEIGGVGPALADYDGDGDLDLFVANYGPDALWRNDGGGRFTEVAAGIPLGADYHSTSAAWGDGNQDGWPDLFVVSYLTDIAEVEDHLFLGREGAFTNEIPQTLQHPGASHGVSWADFDGDGDLDLLLANNHPTGGGHPLYRNLLPAPLSGSSLQVAVRDASGVARFPGSEVRVYEAEGPGVLVSGADSAPRRLLGMGIVDSGGGYCSQGIAPVHVALPQRAGWVTVEVTVPAGGERRVFSTESMAVPLSPYRVLEIRLPEGF